MRSYLPGNTGPVVDRSEVLVELAITVRNKRLYIYFSSQCRFDDETFPPFSPQRVCYV